MYNNLFDELFRFNNEMNKLNRYFGTGTTRTYLRPQVNVYENKDEYLVVGRLPGVDKENINLSLKDNIIKISATRKPFEADKASLHLKEIEEGTFERSIRFDEKIQAEAITAEMKDGLLYVKAPKVPEAKPVTITIK